MITSKDLMTGNLFTDDQNEILKIDLIDSIEETVNANGMEDIPISDLIPIPITEDILLKCEGVERSDGVEGGSEWSLSDEFDIILQESDNKGLWTVSNVFVDSHMKANYLCMGDAFKYFHELQNIVKTMIKKDLICK